MYKLHGKGVIRLSDNALIPNDPLNRDWRKYQDWLSKGNLSSPEDTLPKPIDYKIQWNKIVGVNEKVSFIAKFLGWE